jgi:hypothetical protein
VKGVWAGPGQGPPAARGGPACHGACQQLHLRVHCPGSRLRGVEPGLLPGLRCTTRARASHGAPRVRWLLLATVSIVTTGIWVMHFVAMLGFAIPDQKITSSAPVAAGGAYARTVTAAARLPQTLGEALAQVRGAARRWSACTWRRYSPGQDPAEAPWSTILLSLIILRV